MSQKECVGAGSLDTLSGILDELNPQKICIVAGETSYGASGAKEKLAPILSRYTVEFFSDFSPNPSLPDIRTCIEVMRRFNPDCVIAIGGGSAIDVAKAANILAVQQGDAEHIVTGGAMIDVPGKPLIAIPTTSGTGSEATSFAVVYIGTKKYSLAHELLLPFAAIVDPVLTYSTPPAVAAAAGMDALCQAVESLWSIRSTDESKDYARKAIPLILATLTAAVQGDTHARDVMAEAAHLAGKAINISKTTASHAMSYPFTAHFGIPHGHAVALTLPQVLAWNTGVTEKDCTDPRGLQYVRSTLEEVQALITSSSAFESLMDSIGLSRNLTQLGIKESDLPKLLDGISAERMGNNPRRLTQEDAEHILRAIL